MLSLHFSFYYQISGMQMLTVLYIFFQPPASARTDAAFTTDCSFISRDLHAMLAREYDTIRGFLQPPVVDI
jgi:hypothetical protein